MTNHATTHPSNIENHNRWHGWRCKEVFTILQTLQEFSPASFASFWFLRNFMKSLCMQSRVLHLNGTWCHPHECWSSKFPNVLLLNITMSYRLIIPTTLAYHLLCFRAVSPFLFCEYVHSMVCNHHPSPAFLKAICWARRTGRRWKKSRSREVTVGLRENQKETGNHKL